MNADLPTRLRERQRALRGRGLERALRVRRPSADVIDLAGNDYLGLSRHPHVVQAAIDATREWGTRSTASRLVTGTTAGALIESLGYVQFYLLTTVVALPGVLLYLFMLRAGLIERSLGDAGRVPSAD